MESTTPQVQPPAHPRPGTPAPEVVSVRRDVVSREIRLELADWKTRTGGVYDLAPADQKALALPAHLPPHRLFLPDFVIVLGLGEPMCVKTIDGGFDTVRWTDLRVHVGGLELDQVWDPDRRGLHGVATDFYNLDALVHGTYRTAPAPDWLLQLIRIETPWGRLVDQARTKRP